MATTGARRALIACAVLGTAVAASAWQGEEGLPALAGIEPGLWSLRDRDGGRTLSPICVGADREAVTQIRHGGAACTRVVIAAEARGGTVHYTCPGAGFGRTTVRIETARLMQIDTQGVHEGAPFAFRAEARRVGRCPPGRSAAR